MVVTQRWAIGSVRCATDVEQEEGGGGTGFSSFLDFLFCQVSWWIWGPQGQWYGKVGSMECMMRLGFQSSASWETPAGL